MNPLPLRNTRRRLLALSVGATLLAGAAAQAAEPTVYGESAMVKVHPTTAPGIPAPVELWAARNEFSSFQVVVNGGSAGLTGVKASFDGVTGEGGAISGNEVMLYREAFLNITQTSTADVTPGQWPDGLVPDVDEIAHEKRNAFPFDLPADQTQAIWVDLQVPQNQAPGDYEGTVTVTADGGFTDQVPVTLHVLPATLPSTSSLKSAFLIFSGNVCRAHTGSDCASTTTRNQLVDRYQTLALDYRFSLSNTNYYPADWDAFDAEYAPFLEGHADTALPGARQTSLQFMGTRDATHYQAWADHLRQKGWLDRAFDYTGDEPPYGISFSEIQSRVNLVRQAAPDLRTLVTTTLASADQNGLTADIDTMVPVINQLDGVDAPYVGDQRDGYDGWLSDTKKALWTYQSCMSHGCGYGTNAKGNTNGAGWPSYMVDASAARNRAMQWTAFLEKVSGELYYETANMLPSAWSNQYAFNGNGDGTLFYPGTPARIGGSTDVPLPSMRMKYLRMGMQDYEWLKLVSDAGDPDYARQVAKTLIPTASAVSDDGAQFEKARRELEQRYITLTGGDVSTGGTTGGGTTVGDSGGSQGGGTSSNVDPLLPGDGSPKSLAAGGCSTTGPAGLLPILAVLGALIFEARRRKPTEATVPVRAKRRRR